MEVEPTPAFSNLFATFLRFDLDTAEDRIEQKSQDISGRPNLKTASAIFTEIAAVCMCCELGTQKKSES